MMFSAINRKLLGFAFVIGVLISSTITVVYAAVWLKPGMVLFSAILHLVAAIIALYLIFKEEGPIYWRRYLQQNWLLLPFVGYAFLSIFWSIHPDISCYRFIILISTIILSWYFGQKYSREQFTSYILVFAVLVLFMTIFVTAHDAVMEGEIADRIRGFFWQKNHTALFYSMTSFLCLMTTIRNRDRRNFAYYGAIFLYVISIVLIVWANSASAVFTTLILHGLILLLILWLKFKDQIKKWHYYALVGVILVGVLLAAANLDVVFGLFGRQVNLTGRIPMWKQVYLLYFLKHPWFGYGFNAFWYQSSHRLVIGTVSHLPTIFISDNGFYDILISNGVVGFSLFLLFYGKLWVEPVRALFNAKNLDDVIPFLIMVMIFFGNLTWSMLFENESFYMLVMLTMHFILMKNKVKDEGADSITANPVS